MSGFVDAITNVDYELYHTELFMLYWHQAHMKKSSVYFYHI